MRLLASLWPHQFDPAPVVRPVAAAAAAPTAVPPVVRRPCLPPDQAEHPWQRDAARVSLMAPLTHQTSRVAAAPSPLGYRPLLRRRRRRRKSAAGLRRYCPDWKGGRRGNYQRLL